MLNILSCASWPSVCLLWRNVYLDLLPAFRAGCLFWCCKCQELFVNFGDWSFISNIIRKYLLPICALSFGFVYCFLCCANLLSSSRSHLKFLFVFPLFWEMDQKNILLWFMSQSVLPVFSSSSCMESSLTFRPLIHWSLFLCMELKNDLFSFFYMWLSSFPSTICWRDCLFTIV